MKATVAILLALTLVAGLLVGNWMQSNSREEVDEICKVELGSNTLVLNFRDNYFNVTNTTSNSWAKYNESGLFDKTGSITASEGWTKNFTDKHANRRVELAPWESFLNYTLINNNQSVLTASDVGLNASDGDFVADPVPFVYGETVYLLFEGLDDSTGIKHLYYATAPVTNPADLTFQGQTKKSDGSDIYGALPNTIVTTSNKICLLRDTTYVQFFCTDMESFPQFEYGTPPLVETSATGWDNVSLSDFSVFRHDNYWWVAYGGKNDTSPYKIGLAYARELNGTWTKHPENPVYDSGDTPGGGTTDTKPGGPAIYIDGQIGVVYQWWQRNCGIMLVDELSTTSITVNDLGRWQLEESDVNNKGLTHTWSPFEANGTHYAYVDYNTGGGIWEIGLMKENI